jgi:mannose-6-phosphate isomerase-like protein (cupin superfamily)
MDHLIVMPASSEGLHKHPGVGEVYYVLNGSGEVIAGGETAAIRKGDGVPILPDQAHSIVNNGTENLELMIIGIAIEKGKLDTVELSKR